MSQIILVEAMCLMLNLRASMIIRGKYFYRAWLQTLLNLGKLLLSVPISYAFVGFLDNCISTNLFLNVGIRVWGFLVWLEELVGWLFLVCFCLFVSLNNLSLNFAQAQGWYGLPGRFAFHLQPEPELLSFGNAKHLSWKLS